MNTKDSTKNQELDYYMDDLGRLIYTCAFHLKRGDCCFQGCLHCPYGTTVERYGLSHRYDQNKKIIHFTLKGTVCAKYHEINDNWEILKQFENQNLEDDLKTALNTFYKDRDGQ